MTPADLLSALDGLDPVDQREADSIAALRDFLARDDAPFDQGHCDEHVTASAFLVSRRGVVLLRHKRLGIWVQPGGHIDEGEDPATAALREAREETGVDAAHLDPPLLVHVDVHDGGRGHTHYDLRYLLIARPLDPCPPPGESPDVGWYDAAAAQERAEPALRPALARLAAYVDTLDLPQ